MGAVSLGCRVLMSWIGRSEPGRKCLTQLWVREVSRPGDMSVGSDQHGRGSSDLTKDRELPHAIVPGVDQPDSIRPRRNVETAGFTEVEEHGPGAVQQAEYALGTVRGMQIEVGHAPPEQRVSLSEVVVDVETGEHRDDAPARLVHAL